MEADGDNGGARLPLPQGGGFFFAFGHRRLCRAVHTPPKPMVTRMRVRRHAGPSPELPSGAHWALAQDRYAGVNVDVNAGWRGASGRSDARGDGLCPLRRASRRCRDEVGASAAPCWVMFEYWWPSRAVYTPPKPMVTRPRASKSERAGPSHGTATLVRPTAFSAGRWLLAK